MKKILALMAVFLFTASSSFAAVVVSSATSHNMSSTIAKANCGLVLHGDPSSATESTALIGKTSTGVTVAWETSTAGYSLMTQHISGTKAYGTSYDSTAMYETVSDGTPGAPVYSAGLTKSDSSDFSNNSWKKM